MTRAVRILRSLSPIGLFLGPIFQREVRASGRRRGTYWLRFLYTCGVLVVVTIMFVGLRQELAGQTPAARMQFLQQIAPIATVVVGWFQFFAMGLAAPILTAPCICDERRARTLGVLMTTPLTSAQIVGGKFASRLVQLVILALVATPVLLGMRALGGLDSRSVLAITGISLSTALLGASLGLLYSVWHRRATTATLFAIFTLGLVQGGPSALMVILYHDAPAPPDFRVFGTCGPAALGMLTAELMGGRAGFPVNVNTIWQINVAYNTLVAGAVLLFAMVALRRRMVREAAGDASTGTSRSRRRGRAPAPVAPGAVEPDQAEADGPPGTGSAPPDGAIHLAARDRIVSDRPVLWREIRQASFGSRRGLVIVIGVTVLLLGFLYARVGFGEEGLHASIGVVGALSICLLAVLSTTGGVSGEREAQTWSVLLATPLSARSIVLGKYLGALRRLWYVPTIVLIHLLLGVLARDLAPYVLPLVAAVYIGPALLLSATGVFLSLALKRSTTAAVVNLLLGLALWVGVWPAAAALLWFTDAAYNDSWTDGVWGTCFAINPVAMTVSSVIGAFDSARTWSRGSLAFEVAEWQVSLTEFVAIVLTVLAAYTAAALGVLALAVRLFRRLSGRTS